MNDNKCLYCAVDIPEGRQICPACEIREKGQNVTLKTIKSMTEQKKKAVEEAREQTRKETAVELLNLLIDEPYCIYIDEKIVFEIATDIYKLKVVNGRVAK